MAKNFLIFLAGLVLFAAILGARRVWLAPGVTLSTQGDHVIVSNMALGEYYLGFNEVMIQDGKSGQTIWHARQGTGEDIDSLSFRAGINVTPPRWVVINPKNSDTFVLSPGIEYGLMVWGNNGLSVTKWSGSLVVPNTPLR